MKQAVERSRPTRIDKTQLLLLRGFRLGRKRSVYQLRGIGAEVETARPVAALHLDHADECQVVDRIDPEPGAGGTAPIVGSGAVGEPRRLGIDVDGEIETEPNRL